MSEQALSVLSVNKAIGGESFLSLSLPLQSLQRWALKKKLLKDIYKHCQDISFCCWVWEERLRAFLLLSLPCATTCTDKEVTAGKDYYYLKDMHPTHKKSSLSFSL